MSTISANELKTKGVSILEAELKQAPEVVISVRGKERFVVMDLDHYRYLRDCELEVAVSEARRDLAVGRCVRESAEEHMKSLRASLQGEGEDA